MTGRDDVDQVEEIKLSVPAQAAYSRVARLAITGLAARIGFSYDEIEDLRIAVGEVCGILLDGDGERLGFTCRVSAGGLEVEAGREPVGTRPEVTDLTRQILSAVVDEVAIDAEGARVTVVKQRQV